MMTWAIPLSFLHESAVRSFFSLSGGGRLERETEGRIKKGQIHASVPQVVAPDQTTCPAIV